MKKIVVIAVAIILSMVATEAFGQSQVYSGDKSLKEIRRTIRVIHRQINSYEKSIRVVIMKKSGKLSVSDSLLISNYQNKIDELEINLNSLIIASANNSVRQSMNLTNKDPKKVAEAYLLVKYADNLGGGSLEQNIASTNLKGILVNDTYYNVIAQITGPGNFFREFDIKARGKSREFFLPMIGEYVTIFIYRNQSATVTKKVGPNIIYYDGGTAYSYKATAVIIN
jgi:hypothetical protein